MSNFEITRRILRLQTTLIVSKLEVIHNETVYDLGKGVGYVKD
jgi:hypothetical protein